MASVCVAKARELMLMRHAYVLQVELFVLLALLFALYAWSDFSAFYYALIDLVDYGYLQSLLAVSS